jgi:hypothetical protein
VKKSDVVPALLMLALSAAIAVDTRGLGFWADTTPGPAFVPVWLALAGAVLVVLRLLEARTLGGLIAVPLLAPWLGLLPALSLLVAFLLLVVLRRPLWPSLATLAISIGMVYGIFVGWLNVPLPKGILGI